MKKLADHYFIGYFLLAFIILMFRSGFDQLWTGWVAINTHPSLLLADYLEVGGLGATLLNVIMVLLFNLLIIRIYKIKFSGGLYAALLTVIGFSFFGKTMVNILPIYIGVYIYALLKDLKVKQVILFAMFGTGISPVVSFVMFGMPLSLTVSIPLGILVGILVGIIIPPVASHVIKFHMGYALYNVGFAIGILGIFIASFFKAIEVPVDGYYLINESHHKELLALFTLYSLLTLGYGLYTNGWSFSGYEKLLSRSGRAVSNFDGLFKKPINHINIGVVGLLTVLMTLVFEIKVSGPVFGALMTVIAFSTFGKHPRNIIPVMLGLVLMAYALGLDLSNPVYAIALFFSTALAPIAGQYGVIVGIIAGAMHLVLVKSTGAMHANLVLYNNGFASGFTAAVLVAVIDTIFVKER